MTPEVGETYKAKVTRIEPYGAFLEFAPGKDGLLHVSEIDWQRVESVEDYMKLGDEVDVKIIEVDRDGRVRFSRKALLPKPEGYVERDRRARAAAAAAGAAVAVRRGGGRDRGGRGGGGGRRSNRALNPPFSFVPRGVRVGDDSTCLASASFFSAPKRGVPSCPTSGAARLDLAAALTSPTLIAPGARARCRRAGDRDPNVLEGQVRPRSGLAAKSSASPSLNAPGTVDEDYRGEVQVLLVNLGDEPVAEPAPGDRIAQLVVAPVTRVSVETVPDAEALGATSRGEGGFGSSRGWSSC